VRPYTTKETLVEKIKELLRADVDLGFLLELKKTDIETLIVCLRDRVSVDAIPTLKRAAMESQTSPYALHG